MKEAYMKPTVPIQSLFVLAMAFALIVCMAFVWYIFYQVYTGFAGATILQSAGTNSTESDTVVFFFDNLANYILILGLIFVAVWAWVYSQKRGTFIETD